MDKERAPLSRSDRRVLDFIISKSMGGVFMLSQEAVAASLQVNLKTVSRTFAKLKKERVIAKDGKVWAISPKTHFALNEELYYVKLEEFAGIVARAEKKTPRMPRTRAA